VVIVKELARTPHVRIVDYRCTRGPHDPATGVEVHSGYSLSYVRRGAFGCVAEGRVFELVTGSWFVGRPGAEYVATHDHACGDECLSFQFSRPLVAELGGERAWHRIAAPPLATLGVLAECAQVEREGIDELAVRLAERYVELAEERRATAPSARDRARMVRAAQWLEVHASDNISLDDAAAEAGLGAFHFLRVFASVHGVTPHQYLVGVRLRHAARLLATTHRPITEIAYDVGFNDLSNFVRTFRSAAGVTPRAFRRAAA
jgi:AraC family transcriptional regulator